MKKAFTLVELIVVVIIIGILAAVGLPQYRKALERSRGAEAYAGLGHIQEAEKIYFAENQEYYIQAALDDTGEAELDISLPQEGWTFGIATTDAEENFTATATRDGGPCDDLEVTINEAGVLDDSSWKGCSVF